MWESSKDSSYKKEPQVIVVRLGQRASVKTVELQTKPNRFSSACVIQIGSMEGQHSAIEYN
jgi:hypothetical protein